MKGRKKCLHLHVYHLGNSDLEIHGMVDCQRNKMLSRCKVEHHKYSVWGLFTTIIQKKESESVLTWLYGVRLTRRQWVHCLWLGGLISSAQVLGPSSWHEVPLTGVDKRFHFLLITLADQIPCGIISPRFGPVVANSCLKLEWVPRLSVAGSDGWAVGMMGGRWESSIPSVSSRHPTLPFPVSKEPSSAPFQLSFSFLCLFLLVTQLAARVAQSLIREARETGTMWRWGCRAQHEQHLTLSLFVISLFWTYFIKYMRHNVIEGVKWDLPWKELSQKKTLSKCCLFLWPLL